MSNTRTTLLSSPLGSATVVIPNDSTLLAQKLRTFLLRTYPKPGYLYDLWFPRDRGVQFSRVAEVDRDDALKRLKRFADPNWFGALERSGVKGLTAATASKLVDSAKALIDEVLP